MSESRISAASEKALLSVSPSAASLTGVVGFAFLTALGALLEIPHQPVPFTLQTFFVILAGGILGPVRGALSMVAYLAMGLLGAPVFAGGGFGLARLLGPTGGYLLSFPLAAAVTGLLASGTSSLARTFLASFAGIVVLFAFGTVHLNVVLLHDWKESIEAGFLIFSWWDILKIAGASAIVRAFRRWETRR